MGTFGNGHFDRMMQCATLRYLLFEDVYFNGANNYLLFALSFLIKITNTYTSVGSLLYDREKDRIMKRSFWQEGYC